MITQLTDLHLLTPGHRREAGFVRRRLLSYDRPLNAEDRVERVRKALARARGHIVLTGDLTEDGTPEQFEVLAELLKPYTDVTILPGNHDRYVRGYDEALKGFNRGPVDLGDVLLVPVDTTFEQHWAFSAGRVSNWEAVVKLVKESTKPVVLAQHHPPVRHRWLPMQIMDGNRDHATQRAFLEEQPHAYVVHGHMHVERRLTIGGRQCVYAAPAVVDNDDPVRFYYVESGVLHQTRDASVIVHDDAAR